MGKRGAACGVIGTLTCGGCAPSSPSWRALCARAKRRRVARTSSLKPSLAPRMRPPIESTGGCGFSSRFSSSHLPMRRRRGGFAAGLASIRPAIGFLRSSAYPSTRVDDESAGVCAQPTVFDPQPSEKRGKPNEDATPALPCSLVPCSIWVADPIFYFFLTAQLCRGSPGASSFIQFFLSSCVSCRVFLKRKRGKAGGRGRTDAQAPDATQGGPDSPRPRASP